MVKHFFFPSPFLPFAAVCRGPRVGVTYDAVYAFANALSGLRRAGRPRQAMDRAAGALLIRDIGEGSGGGADGRFACRQLHGNHWPC